MRTTPATFHHRQANFPDDRRTGARNLRAVSQRLLKIADGCSNRCSYCVIPTIRGKARSRTIDDIWKRRNPCRTGRGRTDHHRPGHDRLWSGPQGETDAESTAARIGHDQRHFLDSPTLYLSGPSDGRTLRTMAGEEKICPYLDIPIQHSDDAILGAMHRRGDKQLIRNVVKKAREIIPDIALRTSLIAGFPGETLRRFESLLSFVQEIRFNHLGVFTYPGKREPRPRPPSGFRRGKRSGAGPHDGSASQHLPRDQ